MDKMDNTQGVINSDCLYTLKALSRQLGVSQATIRSARLAGLRVCYVHKNGYVHGRDWIEYVLRSTKRPNGDVKNCPA